MSQLPSSSPRPDTAPTDSGPLGPAGVRGLKIAVVAMGILIGLGLLAVIGRIVYMASGATGMPGRSAAPPAAVADRTLAGKPGGEARLALPAGTVVKSVSLSGDRLSVHYETPDGRKGGIAILDAASGELVRRIEIVPAVP